MVLQQIKLLLLNIISIFRRALCCFSRRRKPSTSDPVESLQSISVVAHNDINRNKSKHTERDWNSWDDSPRTVEEHIEQYRQRMVKPTTPQKEEEEPDFFRELEPVIQPQPKFYLENSEKQEKTDFSRLTATSDIPINPELADWEEENASGWEELDTEHTKQVIREKRRELRNQRQKPNHSNYNHNNNISTHINVNVS